MIWMVRRWVGDQLINWGFAALPDGMSKVVMAMAIIKVIDMQDSELVRMHHERGEVP